MYYKDKLITNMSFREIEDAIKELNYSHERNLNFKKLHHLLVTELNFKSYEAKLYKKNLKNLGNPEKGEVGIPRERYNKIVNLSDAIINSMFSLKGNQEYILKPNPLRELQKII